jgi:hypothetical protein
MNTSMHQRILSFGIDLAGKFACSGAIRAALNGIIPSLRLVCNLHVPGGELLVAGGRLPTIFQNHNF